jgi:hypothetical protein
VTRVVEPVRYESPPHLEVRRRRTALTLAVFAFAIVVGGVLIVHWFPPHTHWFYPRCSLHVWTGLHCPGCGSLRAISALTHGNFAEALGSNLLLSLALPVVGGLFLFRRLRHGDWAVAASVPSWGWWFLLAVVFGFGLLRNLPGPLFEWLRP